MLPPPHATRITMPVPSARHGFTLIELLTVIAIIGILAAIMIPTVSAVRRSARNATCISNLRQVHIAIMAYAQDRRDVFPDVNNVSVSPTLQWWGAVQPYMGAPNATDIKLVAKVLQCPEVVLISQQKAAPGTNHGLYPNYGMSTSLGQLVSSSGTASGKKVRITDVRNPSRTLLAGDNGVNDTTGARQSSLSVTTVVMQGDKHRQGSNFVWVDGHVSTWKDVTRLAEDPYKPGGPEDVWSP
ncbi:N-terminal cleavage protein [Opitutaceae bacterium TAV5]|nr:N-terminal cleavage protein [Opitutaceae bacterium TAV5]